MRPEFSQVVTSSPRFGWSPILAMVMRSSFSKGLSENTNTEKSMTETVDVAAVVGNMSIGGADNGIT